MPAELVTVATRYPGQVDITPDGHPRSHKIYTVEDLLKLPRSFSKWIVQDLFPASQRIFVVGKGSSYKSAVTFDLSVAIADGGGGRMLNYLPIMMPGPVLLISTEGSVYTNRDRLVMHIRAYDISPDSLNLHFCQQSFVLDDPRDAWELNSIVDEMRPVLVVMDPLDSFFSGDENSAKETKIFRRLVDYFIDNYACSVLVIHHVGKDGGKQDPRGSSAWFDWADTVVHYTKKKYKSKSNEKLQFDTAKVVVTKQRNGKDGHVFTVIPRIDDEMGVITFDFMDEGSENRVAHKFMQSEVYKQLNRMGPHTASMLEAALPFGRDKIRAVLQELMASGLVDQGGTLSVPVAGRRPRSVSAWRTVGNPTKVDAAMAILRAAEETAAEDEIIKNPPNIEEKSTIGYGE
jgi:hypothetical protein